VDFVQAAKGSFGIYAKCLVKLSIPAVWVDEFPMITGQEWTRMIEPEQHLFSIKLSKYESVRQGWVLCQPSMCSFLLLNITESSDKRVLEQSNLDWETAKTSDDVIEMFKLLCDSHNFYEKAASLVEQTAIRLKHDTFIWISPEDLQHFKLRWEKLLKELLRVGIDLVMLPPKNRFLQFVSALKVYGHSTVVQMQCIVRAAEVDTNTDYDKPKFYENLNSLSISQHPVITGAPQIKDATALQARTIGQQLKGSKKGAGKKGKSGKDSSSSQPAKESSESNPHTKALVEKKAKETGESAADIRKKIKCHNCGKAGHISTDCKKEKSSKPQKGKSKNKGEKVGSIFSALEVSDAVDSEDDEGFVASQGVVFCAVCDSDNEADQHDDEEGVKFDIMDEDEQMPELIRDEDDDSVVATEPAPLPPSSQPSVFASLYSMPPVSSSENTWYAYTSLHTHTINRHFRNWLAYQRNNYRWRQQPGGPIIYDSSLSESENEAIWQSDNSMRIEHSMIEFFQPDDYRIVTDVMMRRYREYFRYELEHRHFFDATFDPLSNMVGLTVEQFESRALVRDLVSHGNEVTRRMRLDDLRWHVSRLTDAGLMNVCFRTHETEDEGSNVVHLPSSLWNPYKQPSNLGAIPWNDDPPKDNSHLYVWGPTTISPPTSDAHSVIEFMDQDGQDEDAPAVLPVPDTDEPLSTPPKPGSDPVVMSLRSCIKGKSSRPNCFNYFTLDNHADICIFCNASLLTNIRPAEHKVSGISDTKISFDKVGDHPYCGTVIYAPKNKYNLIAMRVIKDNGHRYITDKDNTFIAIMDQNDRLLLKFDYDPLDKFYKVRAEHAFDFMDPAKVSKQSSESAVALPNALIDEAERTYDASMFFTAEQRRRAALVPPIHIALNHPSDAALIEASNSPSLTNCPISAEDIANARVIYGQQGLRGREAVPTQGVWSVKTLPRLDSSSILTSYMSVGSRSCSASTTSADTCT
jgi:hypothetical protein